MAFGAFVEIARQGRELVHIRRLDQAGEKVKMLLCRR